MKDTKNHLYEIIKKLSDSDVKYIICGGVALVLHGIERMTIDLDISVDLEEKNLKKLITAMKELKLVPRVPIPAEALLDCDQRECMIKEKNALVFTFIDVKNPFRQVDIFLTDSLSYKSLINYTEKIKIGDHYTKIISKEKLLEMKQSISPMRDKDKFDIETLKKIIEKK